MTEELLPSVSSLCRTWAYFQENWGNTNSVPADMEPAKISYIGWWLKIGTEPNDV